jgi:hypothetical protein
MWAASKLVIWWWQSRSVSFSAMMTLDLKLSQINSVHITGSIIFLLIQFPSWSETALLQICMGFLFHSYLLYSAKILNIIVILILTLKSNEVRKTL